MIFNAENILLIGSILLFVSIVVSKTGYRFLSKPQHYPKNTVFYSVNHSVIG